MRELVVGLLEVFLVAFVLFHFIEDLGFGCPREGEDSVEHFIEEDTDGPDIGFFRDDSFCECFGCAQFVLICLSEDAEFEVFWADEEVVEVKVFVDETNFAEAFQT